MWQYIFLKQRNSEFYFFPASNLFAALPPSLSRSALNIANIAIQDNYLRFILVFTSQPFFFRFKTKNLDSHLFKILMITPEA